MSNKKKTPRQVSGNPAKRAADMQATAERLQEKTEAAKVATRTIDVEYDGRVWTIDPAVIVSPEMMYLLADMQEMAEVDGDELTAEEATDSFTTAMNIIRLLFGRRQGLLFTRATPTVEAIGERLFEFFEKASAQAGSPDPTDGSGSSDDTEGSATQPSVAATA